jgi:hypothetical protein
MMLASIDGVAAPESPLAPALAARGFVARQGVLVRLPDRAADPEDEAFEAERARA